MKNLFTLLVTTITLNVFLTANAAVLTVDNNEVLSGSPGQYSNLQTACTDAYAGDTILIVGSIISYGDVTITKKLNIIGTGYNPQRSNTNTSLIGTIYLGNGSSGTFISGIYCNSISYSSNLTVPLSNIKLERSRITSSIPLHSLYSNITIYNNILSGIVLNGASNVNILNNIIFGGFIAQSTSTSVYIKNNLFYYCNHGDYGSFWGNINMDISNNIFYNSKLYGAINSCSFNNNLTYNCTPTNDLPFGSNVGSGNIINQDPVFLKEENNTFSYTNNYMIHSSSPCKNAGTDGTDIGPSGGSYPFTTSFPLTGMPAIPVITKMQINGASSVPYGNSTINVNVKAKKIN